MRVCGCLWLKSFSWQPCGHEEAKLWATPEKCWDPTQRHYSWSVRWCHGSWNAWVADLCSRPTALNSDKYSAVGLKRLRVGQCTSPSVPSPTLGHHVIQCVSWRVMRCIWPGCRVWRLQHVSRESTSWPNLALCKYIYKSGYKGGQVSF